MAGRPAAPLEYVLGDHAALQMRRRELAEATVRAVIETPEQAERIRRGRVVLQSRVRERDKTYLVRVFLDIDRNPAEVVTAYRTSRLAKYWRREL